MKIMQPIYLHSKSPARLFLIAGLLSLVTVTGCKKYLDIPLPADRITEGAAFSNDKTCAAVVNNILISLDGNGILTGTGFGFTAGLYADELQNIAPPGRSSTYNTPYYTDLVSASDNTTGWLDLYKQIYNANQAIEGITGSPAILLHKNQWLGESYFLRALFYFYVANLFGDGVLTTSTDYRVNRTLPRASQSDVYGQIVKDLIAAQGLLSAAYQDANGAITTGRARPNKFAASALLARVYLYTGDWANAKAQADSVINGVIKPGTQYSLVPPANIANTFLATSPELIFGIAPGSLSPYGPEWSVYNSGMPAVLPDYPAVNNYTSAALASSLVDAFETDTTTMTTDLRKTNWTRAVLRPGGGDPTMTITWYFPDKYKSRTAGDEFTVVLRLAEQYLVRAEANARLNDLPSAITDLNSIRTRAGLPATSASSQTDILAAILKERRVELFTEAGHRLFDLRRAGVLDAVMNAEIVNKPGAAWDSYKKYWPIPVSDIQQNSFLVQTPGY